MRSRKKKNKQHVNAIIQVDLPSSNDVVTIETSLFEADPLLEGTSTDEIAKTDMTSCIHNDDEYDDACENPIEEDEKKLLRAQKKKAYKNRETGKEYWGYKLYGKKIRQDILRAERILGMTCTSKFCKKSSLRHCSTFCDDDRKMIFQRFWKMNWSQKKAYVCNLAEVNAKKANALIKSRRSKTKIYYLWKADNKKYQVCRKMFLNTLGIKEKMLRYWLDSKLDFGMFDHPDDINEMKMIKRREGKYYKKNQERKAYLRRFLIKLPKLESHYCRKDTKKKYLQTEHRTLAAVYKDYVNFCHKDNIKKLSMSVFSAMIKTLNYSLFKPRKDLCDTCSAFKAGNTSREEFVNHRNEINSSRKEKEKDISDAKEKLCTLLCMDVEAVQLLPKHLASCLYFSLKLQMHNFTIYDIISHKSVNYIWDESEGELEASIFVSIIILHIENLIEKELIHRNTLIIYSDGCCYQNRNAILSSAFSHLAMKHSLTIYQKFLVKGHTQMECDSSHSLIERETKKKKIHVPDDFVDAVASARTKPFPLDAVKLTHNFFRNFDDSNLISYKSIRPGAAVGDPKVTDLRCLQYTKDGKIFYKLSHTDEYKILPQKHKAVQKYEPKKLYKGRLEISYKKYTDLQKLKTVLNVNDHGFFDNLKHKPKPKNEKAKA